METLRCPYQHLAGELIKEGDMILDPFPFEIDKVIIGLLKVILSCREDKDSHTPVRGFKKGIGHPALLYQEGRDTHHLLCLPNHGLDRLEEGTIP